MHFVRRGTGKPLLLLHGLGGSWQSWAPILDALALHRDVIAVDLPGFGETPPVSGETSIATLSDAVTDFLKSQNLIGIDAVGSSMGARLVLELARRRVLGTVVSLDPGGFWRGWEKVFFHWSVWTSIRLIRVLRPIMAVFTSNPVGRTLLLSQFSARPWALSPRVTQAEMATSAKSPSYDELLDALVHGPEQQGAAAGTTGGAIVIGWGRSDRVCLPRQAARAVQKFEGAAMHWFERCGHFPQWDAPEETVRLILDSTR